MEKLKNLGEECGFYAQEIFSGTLVLNRVEVEVSALKGIEKQDFLKFYDQKISSHGLDQRKLSIQIYSSQHTAELQASKSRSEVNRSVTELTRKFLSFTLEYLNSGSLPDEGDVRTLRNLKSIRIKDIQTFKLSQSLYGIPTGLAAFLASQN